MNQTNKNQGSKIARRTAARLAAVQALYQMKANNQTAEAVIDEFKAHRMEQTLEGQVMLLPDAVLFADIISGADECRDDIKGVIDACLVKHDSAKAAVTIDSMESLLGSILLCGSFELLAHHEIDIPVIISDYLEVTHAFYEGGEAKLVNGVLDSVGKVVRK